MIERSWTRRRLFRAFGLGLAAAYARPSSAGTRREVVATGHEEADLRSFDELMTGFLQQHNIPGAALAVTRNGHLVYARGFGYADVEAREPVQPDSLFRIASVTKPITAVAVLRLVDAHKLGLDDKVFDVLKLGERVPEGATLDERWKKVTIRELLRHTGGWDRDKSFDPMFRQVEFAKQFGDKPPAKPDHIIRAMLGYPLDFDPGQRHAYSNFGYCLLGRVIEAKTGQTYEEHVREHVLKPLGIHGMRIGRTRLEERAKGEVRYYTPPNQMATSVFPEDAGKPVAPPYGAWSLETLDAHGGWIASAADLVRFASAVDEGHKPPLLRRPTIRAMFARPPGEAGYEPDRRPKDAYYALGWSVRPVGRTGRANTWHSGLLPGTSTILVRRFDGLSWAVLFNAHDAPGGTPSGLIDPLVHEAADKVRHWPRKNLFPELLPREGAGSKTEV